MYTYYVNTLFIHVWVCLRCLFVCLSVRRSVCLSICLSVRLYTSWDPSSIYLSIYQSDSRYLSICRHIDLIIPSSSNQNVTFSAFSHFPQCHAENAKMTFSCFSISKKCEFPLAKMSFVRLLNRENQKHTKKPKKKQKTTQKKLNFKRRNRTSTHVRTCTH